MVMLLTTLKLRNPIATTLLILQINTNILQISKQDIQNGRLIIYKFFCLNLCSGLKLSSYVFMEERMNGNPLAEAEKQEIETAFCYSLKRAVTGILQRESHDSQLVNEVLINSNQLMKHFEDLHDRTNDSYLSSVVLDLVFQNCSDLEIFMDKCMSGQKADVIGNTLVTECILSILNLRSLQFSVSVSDEDFDKYHKKLQIQDGVFQENADTHVCYIQLL